MSPTQHGSARLKENSPCGAIDEKKREDDGENDGKLVHGSCRVD